MELELLSIYTRATFFTRFDSMNHKLIIKLFTSSSVSLSFCSAVFKYSNYFDKRKKFFFHSLRDVLKRESTHKSEYNRDASLFAVNGREIGAFALLVFHFIVYAVVIILCSIILIVSLFALSAFQQQSVGRYALLENEHPQSFLLLYDDTLARIYELFLLLRMKEMTEMRYRLYR